MDLSYTSEEWASVEWAKTFELGKVSPKNIALIGIRSNRNTMFEKYVAEELGIRLSRSFKSWGNLFSNNP